MYCFEAHKCTKYDCPVQKWQVKRCWKFLEDKHKHLVTIEECPYAPCERCNYKLGWEIGLIGDSMFPENPDPTAENILPESIEEVQVKKIQIESVDEKNDEADKKVESAIEESETEVVITKSDEKVILDVESEEDSQVGQKGLRFCYEILDCPNPNCVVRRRQIIQCFKYFSRKGKTVKAEMTCSGRKCEDCFVKRGWDIGTLDENMFLDILESKRLKIVQHDSIKIGRAHV